MAKRGRRPSPIRTIPVRIRLSEGLFSQLCELFGRQGEANYQYGQLSAYAERCLSLHIAEARAQQIAKRNATDVSLVQLLRQSESD